MGLRPCKANLCSARCGTLSSMRGVAVAILKCVQTAVNTLTCNVHTIKPTTFPHRRGVVRPSCGIPTTLCPLHGQVAHKSCSRHRWCQEMIDFMGIRGLNELKLMQCMSFNRSSSILRRIVENAAIWGHPHIKKQAKQTLGLPSWT